MRNFFIFVFDKVVTILLFLGLAGGVIVSYYFANLGYRFNFGIFFLNLGVGIILASLTVGLLLIPLRTIELLSKNNELLKKIQFNLNQNTNPDSQINVIPKFGKRDLKSNDSATTQATSKKIIEPFIGERNLLNNDSYREYLIKKYNIKYNDETNKFDIESNSYSVLHRALEYAHEQDIKK
tara:strand:+ start:42 stop:584 length:543 start_codon:yes stop_codon:yes gene_type:complete